MNPFQKNPFVNNNETTIKGYNPVMNERQKIEQIKLDMNKVKQIKQIEPTLKNNPQMTVSQKIDALRNIKNDN